MDIPAILDTPRIPLRAGVYLSENVRHQSKTVGIVDFNLGQVLESELDAQCRLTFLSVTPLEYFPWSRSEAERIDVAIVVDQLAHLEGWISGPTQWTVVGGVTISIYSAEGEFLKQLSEKDSMKLNVSIPPNGELITQVSHEGQRIMTDAFISRFLNQISRMEIAQAAREGEPVEQETYRRAASSGRQIISSRTSGSGMRTRTDVAGGYYLLEKAIDFNILDSVFFDPRTGQVTLIGHHDPRYEGPKIPYLQHLAALIDNPSPEFSLEWTPDSERKVDDFLRRMDSIPEMRRVIEEWGEWFTSDGRVTTQGRIMLPLFGVRPTDNGKDPGYLGAEVGLVKSQSYGQKLPITRVKPNSPAQSAGLQVGDNITFIGNKQPYHPTEVISLVRRTGAGAETTIKITRPGIGDKDIRVTLGAGSGDPWNDLSRFDILVQIFYAADMHGIGYLLDSYNRFQRLTTTEVAITVLWDIITATGNYNKVTGLQTQLQSGRISQHQFNMKLFRFILEGTDKKFNMTKLVPVYDNALDRGNTPEDAFDTAYTNLSTYIQPAFKEAVQKMYSSNNEIVMPLSVVESSLIAKPRVIPEYTGVDPSSQLARVMLEADYLGKTFLNDPKLKNRIQGFETLYSFCRGNSKMSSEPACKQHARMWFSIESAKLAQLADGNSMEIRDIKMRINVRSMDWEGNSDSSTHGGKYEDLLTSLYDDFSSEYPILHELREAAKLAIAARWIVSRKADFRMPAYGKTRWQGPDELPGVVHLIWSPKHVKVVMMADGGVSLVPPENVSQETIKDAASMLFDSTTLVRAPEIALDSLTSIVKLPKSVVPKPSGWVTREITGGKDITSVSIFPDRDAPNALKEMEIGSSLEENALLLWNMNDLKSAEKKYMEIIDRQSDPVRKASVMLIMAQVQQDMGESETALRTLNEALRLAPDDPHILAMIKLMYAKLLAETGDRMGSIKALKGYLSIHPDNLAATELLAEMEKDPGALRTSSLPAQEADERSIALKKNKAFKKGVSILRELEGGSTVSGFDTPKKTGEMIDIPVPDVVGQAIETYAPVPDTVPAFISKDSRYEKAHTRKGFKEIQNRRSELIKKQNELRIILKEISTKKEQEEVDKETVNKQIEKYTMEENNIKDKIKDTNEEMMNFMVTFKEEGEKEDTETQTKEKPEEKEKP